MGDYSDSRLDACNTRLWAKALPCPYEVAVFHPIEKRPSKTETCSENLFFGRDSLEDLAIFLVVLAAIKY